MKPLPDRVVVCLSGGLDSSTLLMHELEKRPKDNIVAVSFDYGQKHRRELECAADLASSLGVTHKLIVTSDAFLYMRGKSALLERRPVPEGHYEEDSMKATVVPCRNAFFLTILYGVAMTYDADRVSIGIHAGDHAIYPDCRPEFLEAMNNALHLANAWHKKITLSAPFIRCTKSNIVGFALMLGLDFSKTHTCYNGREVPCGRCGSCVERFEAFSDNNAAMYDPHVPSDRWEFARKVLEEKRLQKASEKKWPQH